MCGMAGLRKEDRTPGEWASPRPSEAQMEQKAGRTSSFFWSWDAHPLLPANLGTPAFGPLGLRGERHHHGPTLLLPESGLEASRPPRLCEPIPLCVPVS